MPFYSSEAHKTFFFPTREARADEIRAGKKSVKRRDGAAARIKFKVTEC